MCCGRRGLLSREEREKNDDRDILLSGCVRGAPRRIWGLKVRNEAIASILSVHGTVIKLLVGGIDEWNRKMFCEWMQDGIAE
jgi:hypothetical protein